MKTLWGWLIFLVLGFSLFYLEMRISKLERETQKPLLEAENGIAQIIQVASNSTGKIQAVAEKLIELIDGRKSEVIQEQNNAVQVIELKVASTTNLIDSLLKNRLSETYNGIASDYQDKLKVTLSDFANAEKSLSEARAEYDERLYEMPEPKSLDQVAEYYLSKFGEKVSTFEIERFETRRGSLSFHRGDVLMCFIPSTGKLAYIRIGKEQSSENAELIKQWLDDSTAEKTKMGYKRVSTKTSPTEYGQKTVSDYEKGDLYFQTYFQTTRMIETYNRYSLMYKFYIEMGSKVRRERFFLEDYNNKTGG